MDYIHKLQNTTREKSNAKAEKNSHKVKERASRTKRCAQKIPSGRPASSTPSSPDSPSCSSYLEKEKVKSYEDDPTISGANSKKPAPTKATSSVPKNVAQSKPFRPTSTPNPVTSSGHVPSPDQDDHLPIKNSKSSILKGLILRLDPLYGL